MSGQGSSAFNLHGTGFTSADLTNVHTTLTTLINRLGNADVNEADVIQWACPVPSFGDLTSARVATLGLNPSNREFMDEFGHELQGPYRRLPTLDSLGLTSWADVDARHLRLILDACRSYFLGNSYDAWFKRLDFIVAGADASYYQHASMACHLDLVPYATTRKWTELTAQQRSLLLASTQDTLGLLLRDSPVRILILNGKSVVEQFEEIAGVWLERQEMPAWSLSRQSRRDVIGIAYKGIVDTLSRVMLDRNILVLGFNHNIQGSFGVTTKAIQEIREWITQASKEPIQ